jgi:hypothetical protein
MRTTGNEEPQTNAKNAYVCATRSVQVGTYQEVPGPGTEGPGIQDATADLISVGYVVDAAVNLVKGAIWGIRNLFGYGAGETAGGEISASTPTGVRGSPLKVVPGTNADTFVGGIEYSGHALDEMQAEGITPSVVKDAVKNGSTVPSYGGRIVHCGDGIKAVTENGKVVTVMLQSR